MFLHTYRRCKTLCDWFFRWQELLCQWLYCLWLHVLDVVQDDNGFFHVYWSILKLRVHHQHVLCHADQTWLWQLSHSLSVCYVGSLCCNSRPVVTFANITKKTSSVVYMPDVWPLQKQQTLCSECVLFLSLFYYDTWWHAICQSTEIHYSEVLTVPQVNQTIKLCENELNICKLCASDTCVTIFVHRNIWAQLFWLFHRSSCVHQCSS
jgi:hypothetical protein